MDRDLSALYRQYTAYVGRLQEDLAKTCGHLSSEAAGLRQVRRLDFQQFRDMWAIVCRDAGLEDRWLRRLERGYDRQKEAIGEMLNDLISAASGASGSGDTPRARKVEVAV